MAHSFQGSCKLRNTILTVALVAFLTATAAAQQTTSIPPGLTDAMQAVGQNILGGNTFMPNPGPPTAPALDVWLSDTAALPVHLNIFVPDPGPPETWLRLTIANGQVLMEQDTSVTSRTAVRPNLSADLSGFVPPNPITEVPPSPVSPVPQGLVRALQKIGQNILGSASFFSATPTDAPALDLWLSDTAALPVHLNIFLPDPGPPTTWLRLTIANGQVLADQDPSITSRNAVIPTAGDLSMFPPPIFGITDVIGK